MNLEKRIEILEKRVAELEGRVQEQPHENSTSFSYHTHKSIEKDEDDLNSVCISSETLDRKINVCISSTISFGGLQGESERIRELTEDAILTWLSTSQPTK